MDRLLGFEVGYKSACEAGNDMFRSRLPNATLSRRGTNTFITPSALGYSARRAAPSAAGTIGP